MAVATKYEFTNVKFWITINMVQGLSSVKSWNLHFFGKLFQYIHAMTTISEYWWLVIQTGFKIRIYIKKSVIQIKD